MKLRQMFMASTAMLMLTTTYLPVQAQTAAPSRLGVAQAVPPALAGAIQTYREAQAMLQSAQAAGEDTAAAQQALDAAQGELAALCAALGQPDIQACIALAESGGFEAPAAPQPAPEPEPQPAQEPVIEPEPAPEPAPQPDPAPAPEPAPAPQPEPQPAPQPEPAPAPQPEPAPQPDPAPQPAPEPAPPPRPEPAPQPAPEPAPAPAPQPAQQPEPAPAPVEPPQATPETPAPAPAAPASSAPAPLAAAADAYRQALADYEAALASGGDTTASAQALAEAEADLREICAVVGLVDLDTCLATFGIDLEVVTPEAPAAPTPEAPAAPVTETPAEPLPAPEEELRDDIVLEGDVQGELVPESVDASEVAPLLDSDKDAFAAEARGDVEAVAPTEAPAEPAPQAEPVAAPTSDTEAQPVIDTEEIVAITAEEGTRRETAPLTATQQGAELVGPVETPTNMELITTIGLATVFAIGANYFINSLDTPRIVEDNYRDYWIEDLPGGRTREIIVRPDGTQLVTVRDRYGDIVRRSRIERDGREILLVYVDESYNRYDDQGRWIDPGRQLPPLRLNIPARDYVLDASYADEQRVASFLSQPPVETLQRYYTIEEVKRSSRLRDMVRRLEIGDLTFETASANIGPDQVSNLSSVANAMLDLIRANPAETFLIEGHSDAVGADLYNLELSNRRAESIAYALTRVYGIPPENLATQGYGERYLKINTQAAERLNRRVTIRRITPLITPVGYAG